MSNNEPNETITIQLELQVQVKRVEGGYCGAINPPILAAVTSSEGVQVFGTKEELLRCARWQASSALTYFE